MIKEAILKMGFVVGCYNVKVDTLSKANQKIIIESLDEESTDIQITDKRIKYVVTIDTVDGEKDLSIRTLAQYENQFGDIENR